MERIAPLAKILAEANGIDWQQLRGTGDSGMVVEQDILNYLSRIMSGEEEPPATPVDLPPPDWNGDMNAMPDLSGLSADQLARAGVESDIAALLSASKPGAAPSPEVMATPPADLDDDMEFELDDADPAPDTAAAPAPAASATPSLGGWEWSAPGGVAPAAPLDVAAAPTVDVPTIELPEVSAPTAPDVSAPTFQFAAAPVPVEAVPVEAVPVEAAPVEAASVKPAPVEPAPVASAPVASVAATGLGSLLSRLYQSPTPAPEETPEPAPAMDIGAFPAPMDADLDLHAGPVLDTGTPAPDSPQAAPAQAAVPVAAEPEPMAAPQDASAPAAEIQASDAQPSDAQPSDAQPAAPVPAAPVQSESAAAPADPEQPAPVAASPSAPVQPGGDAVWFGTYLRRDTDFDALSALHSQLVSALGQDLPLALLVARAAQRHVAALGLGSVALHSGGQARSVAGDTLRAAADSLAYDYQGTPDVLVVDAGAHGLDELHYPHTTTLSVGRVQEGRAALTLNGTVDAAQGAAFLAAVADTLGQPVLLLL